LLNISRFMSPIFIRFKRNNDDTEEVIITRIHES
jgi:hypothetical protein